ncbi:4-alpha-glucanotransferase [Skermanella stibiiresistens SB22]|uniref:4-alpha-glucanotransferase n=1 Tax=Skermanella stibiiresistens SB22 TaxID=1385369 RepID=W9GY72_9PROT|nr:4-alpha-glucanotransferase [Skermanella stibiiresistens]EWY38880.1 4-alpha-glucanotransferase [Skermanella stibiiresistens SB22]
MKDGADLDRLAEFLGVEPYYHDIWGNRREIGPATKRDLAQAMGCPAGTPEEAADSLHRLTEREWRRMLKPVFVLGEGVAEIDFSVPVLEANAGITWTLSEEFGDVHWGEQPLSDLPPVADATFDDIRYTRHKLTLPESLPQGYHRMAIQLNVGGSTVHEGAATVIVAPERCLSPDELAGGDGWSWGMGVQLYALRSPTNWGIGDYADAGAAAEQAGRLGAGVLGLNPLHSLFAADPNHSSPYSPSNRGFLNTLAIDVAGLPELDDCPAARALIGEAGFQERLKAAREADLVDYQAVSDLKMPVLELIFQHVRGTPGPRQDAFLLFQREMGEPLVRQAVFEALHERFFKEEGKWSWRDWPEAFQDPRSDAVARFAEERAGRVEFFQWLQFLADDQLAAAAHRARTAGMTIGFYRDLAVANHPGGAAAWSAPDVIVQGANVGSPPDMFSPDGQNWGLAPLSPLGLIESAYEPFIQSLRANMRHAGAIRIDHVMALQHLFWIPSRPNHEGGAYVTYPLRDLVRVIALESRRNRCLVIGEDLGTVPEGFRPAMERAGILSYRVLYFERGADKGFIAPEHYPRDALVSVTTHDLPTLKGWWNGHDIRVRAELGQYSAPGALDAELAERATDRERLLSSMRWVGVVPRETRSDVLTTELVGAIHGYLARTPGRILMVQVEDMVGEIDQPNLPGTVSEHPNWRRKLPVEIARIGDSPLANSIVDAIRREHGRD